MVGDFNSDPNKSRTWRDLTDFAAHNSLMIEDLKMPADSFTYLNPAHNTTSWIDHLLVSRQVHVTETKILYDKALFDHFPLFFAVRISSRKLTYPTAQNKSVLTSHFVNWRLMGDREKIEFNESFCREMSEFEQFTNLSSGTEEDYIDAYYNSLVRSLHAATEKYLFRNRRKIYTSAWMVLSLQREICHSKTFISQMDAYW